MSRLKMAVVGVGALGKHHARILAGLNRVELVAVSDVNEDLGRQIADQHDTEFAADYKTLADKIDAVSVVVPTTYHLDVASHFLKQGTPVLVEKPLAINIEQADKLLSLANKHDAILQVGHIERFNPAMQVARPLCGNPKYIKAERTSPFPFRSMDVGVVHDVMIHDLDLILNLVQSPVRNVQAFGISLLGDHEDIVQAHLEFENGCIVDVTANRVCPTMTRNMQVWSSSGQVNIDFADRTVSQLSPSETMLYGTPIIERAKKPDADIDKMKQEMFGTYFKVNEPGIGDVDALTDELNSFIDCIETGIVPLVDGQAGRDAMQLADNILQAVASHQWDGHAAGAIGPKGLKPVQHRDAA